jgi:ATP-dependent RNA helicase DDX19/DBP5
MFASKFAPSANKIELQKEELSVDGIRQFYMDCRDEEHKYDILVSLYSLLTIGQSIIFCQVCILEWNSALQLAYMPAASAHG